MSTVTTADLAANRLDNLLVAVTQELASYRAAIAAPKAQALQNRSLLSLENLIEQGQRTVDKFDATADEIIANIKAVAAGSASQMKNWNGTPGPIKNEDAARQQIMALATSLTDTLLARARSAFQLQVLVDRLAQSAPAASYEPSHEGEPAVEVA